VGEGLEGMKLDMWTPVYNTGCGWRDCPECGPLIEIEIEAAHRRMVRKTVPDRARMSEWLADAYGTGQERSLDLVEKRKAARADRMRARERVRIKRVLTNDQRAEALEICEMRIRLKKPEARAELLAETFVELLNPTVLIEQRECRFRFPRRVKRAIKRAEHNITRRKKDDRRYVSRKGV
jgi:hypothetical protein